jgi:type II secretion system protein H
MPVRPGPSPFPVWRCPRSTGLWPGLARRRGVTFVEIMVVLMILSIMALVSVPTLKGYYRKNELKVAAREFVAVARYARQEAILRNSPTEVQIDFKHDSYRLVLDPMKKSDFRSSHRESTGEIEQEHVLATATQKLFFEKVESATDPFGAKGIARIRFFRNGSVSASTIVIASPDKRRMTVQIAGATGAMRVYQGEPEVPDPNALQPGATP